ncbi:MULTISPECIES: Spy/CpxP family protein refolding chaperone [Spirulina sp. CCY15215]|uniref:Spy/CpxP family protein refolding chaperone n=1 Tax=Spirulina sp. CCY15215 TaxID=2767591 RepID=UPI0019529481|nr:Spy/CpxP family protein refolding chaperone [Spirulina major]
MKLQKFVLLAVSPLVFTLGGAAVLMGADALHAQFESPAIAQEAPNGRPERGNRPERGEPGERGDRGMRMFEQLNLSADQKQEIQTIREQAKANSEQLREQMENAREQMQSLMASNASDGELRQQHQRVQNLHQQMGDRRFDTMLQIRQVLTPEQRAQLAEMKPDRGGRRGGGDRS